MNPPTFRSEKDRLREAKEEGYRRGVVVGIFACLVGRAIVDAIVWVF